MTATLQETFDGLRDSGKKALIPYLMSGFPTTARFAELVAMVHEAGADALEIGIPFTDPLADGPVIQAAGQTALEQGVTLTRTMAQLRELKETVPEIPWIVMSYWNPISAFGWNKFARTCSRSGVTGWIIPDRDLDEGLDMAVAARMQPIDTIPLVAPTTPAARMKEVLAGASGFVYLVSVTGVTGARRGSFLDLDRYAQRVRRYTKLPRCVGFGISNGEQAAAAAQHTEGVIVGSALLQPFLNQPYRNARRESEKRLVDIRRGLDRSR